MQPEEFETRREFNQKFPGKIYYCFWCKTLTTDPNICTWCGRQANVLFQENAYKYIIKDESTQVNTIFKPVELQE